MIARSGGGGERSARASVAAVMMAVMMMAAPAPAAMLGSNPSECEIARALLGGAGPGCPPAPPPVAAPVPVPPAVAPSALTPPAAPSPGRLPARAAAQPSPPAAPAELKAGFLINFDFASARIRPESRPVLDSVAAVLKAKGAETVRFRIIGHTDSVGTPAVNQRLSERRAGAVKAYLVHRHGIAAARLETQGMGEREPADPDHPAAAENRRVEIVNLGR